MPLPNKERYLNTKKEARCRSSFVDGSIDRPKHEFCSTPNLSKLIQIDESAFDPSDVYISVSKLRLRITWLVIYRLNHNDISEFNIGDGRVWGGGGGGEGGLGPVLYHAGQSKTEHRQIKVSNY